MNTRLFLLGLCATLLVACSTQKETSAPKQPRVTYIEPLSAKQHTKLSAPIVRPSTTAAKAMPNAITLKKPSEKKEHIYKGYNERQTNISTHMRLLTIMSEQTNSSTNNIVYPDYYGGAYYDDTQKLVVLITENDSACSLVKELRERLGNRKFIYRTCKNSYNSLKEVNDSIVAQFERKTPLALNIGMFGIREMDNKVGVHLTDASDKRKLELFDLFGKDKVMITGYGPITIIED